MNTQNYNVEDLLDDCKDELRSYIEDNPSEPDDFYYDIIAEIADSSCPIYYDDILEYGKDPIIRHWKPDLTCGNEEPHKYIQICIYEYLSRELWGIVDDLLDEVRFDKMAK